ncbi:MAG TPA: hypothetical protein VJ697_03935 [Nitrososphaeraceae archaeon]|nr:hypothetical protein [Nitrososphaeraceae archaeon]
MVKEPIDLEKAEDINIDDNYVILVKKMGVRSYPSEELIDGEIASDWQNWFMCYRCYDVIPRI